MHLLSYPPVYERPVLLNGREVEVERIWQGIKQTHPLAMDEEHYLVVSNTRQTLLVLSGERHGDVFHILNMVPMTDKPFYQWKNLMRQLEVVHFDVVLDPSAHVEHGICQAMGLEFVTKRVKFTPFDVSRFNTRAPMIHRQENCSLDDMERVCQITKQSLPGYKHVLKEVAFGFMETLVRKQNDKITSVLFVTQTPNTVTVANYVSVFHQQDRQYAQDFSEFFRYLLKLCGTQKKSLYISLDAKAEIPTYDGITHEVVTHHYTIA